MPELPEVEAYRRLAEEALHRPISAVALPDLRYIRGGTTPRQLRRVLTSLKGLREDLLRHVGGHLMAFDHLEQVGEGRRSHPTLLNRQVGGVAQPLQVTQLPVGRQLWGHPESDDLLEVLRVTRAGREQEGLFIRQPVLALEARPSRGRELGQTRPHLLDLSARYHQRGQVRLRKVAVLLGFLLAPLGDRPLLQLAPAPRLLAQPSTLIQYLPLTRELVLQGPQDAPEGVHVLDLDLDSQGLGADRAQRDVGVAAEAALFHVPVVHPDVDEHLTERRQVGSGFRGTAQVRLPHDFHQRHPGPVQVDQGEGRVVDLTGVMKSPGIFFQMYASDARSHRPAPDLEIQPTAERERQIVLGDLIPLGEVRVEVVLAVKLRELGDLTVQRQRGPEGEPDPRLVDHR